MWPFKKSLEIPGPEGKTIDPRAVKEFAIGNIYSKQDRKVIAVPFVLLLCHNDLLIKVKFFKAEDQASQIAKYYQRVRSMVGHEKEVPLWKLILNDMSSSGNAKFDSQIGQKIADCVRDELPLPPALSTALLLCGY